MTETAAEFIERKSAEWQATQGQPVRTKDVGREGWHRWSREAWTLLPQHNHAEKVLVIERWRLVSLEGIRAHEGGAEAGDIEYRFGYYIVGRIGRAAHRWTWGQFSPLIPHPDLQRLLDKAGADGTLFP